MLRIFAGSVEDDRRRELRRDVPLDVGSIEDSREFLSVTPTPCMPFSSGSLPCQYNVYSCSPMPPFDGGLLSSTAAMSVLSFLGSWLMTAICLASSTWARSCERPGHIVLTFQLANRRVVYFLVFLLLLGAWFAVCSYWLGAVQLETAGR